jgi:hypothetical protein
MVIRYASYTNRQLTEHEKKVRRGTSQLNV